MKYHVGSYHNLITYTTSEKLARKHFKDVITIEGKNLRANKFSLATIIRRDKVSK